MKKGYRISVALAAYNGEEFISAQLESIISQTVLPDEIVISDDGSTDRTLKIISDFQKRFAKKVGIKVVKNHLSPGVIGNFENALRNTTGDIIFLSDQDDYWMPHKIGKALELMGDNKDTFFFSDAVVTDENLKETGLTLFRANGIGENKLNFFLTSPKNQFYLLLWRNFIAGMTMAFWRESLEYFLPFPSSWPHDHWIGVVLSALGYRAVVSREPLVLYRQHKRQATGVGLKLSLPWMSVKRKCSQAGVLAQKLWTLEREGASVAVKTGMWWQMWVKFCLIRLWNVNLRGGVR